MRATFLPFLLAILLAGCTTVPGSGGSVSGYYSNQPGGAPRFRIVEGMSGCDIAVNSGNGWTQTRSLKRLSTDDPALKAIPWLSRIVESAYGIDGFTFIQFRKGATVGGESLPSSYYLAPGGWAYRVPPPAKR